MFKPQRPITRASRSRSSSFKRNQVNSATRTRTKPKNSVKIKKPSLEEFIEYERGQSQSRLKSSWANIIRRYKDVSEDEADVIDINSQEVIVDRGIIQKDDVHTFGKESDPRHLSSPSDDDDTIWWSDLWSEKEIEFVGATIDLLDRGISRSEKNAKNVEESCTQDADEITLWIDDHLPRIDSDLDIDLEDSEVESRVGDENYNDSDSIEIPCDTSSDEQSIPIQDHPYDIVMDTNSARSPIIENQQSSCTREEGAQENLQKRVDYCDIESGSEGFETCSDYE
ncbi:12860_t:CDS:1 [Acaulospora colombiana]|uniref:12860_t:CDS:1 n=1 Tax=Acaulospora colombiana TaxID=27376 RepID=A0ACA9QHD7_9GLOM|nr:12860_t:CDS:1 [Acaulospora colombiana]